MVDGNQAFPHGQEHVRDHVIIYYRAGHGRAENENQDAYWPRNALHRRPVVDYLVAGRLYIVADGVGGYDQRDVLYPGSIS
jgi:serine/threonine protein phosphatase PrpC